MDDFHNDNFFFLLLRADPGKKNFFGNSIQIMHMREVVRKNYSPRGNFLKV